jgi:DNA-directed RNA polymerase subunit RPC12/RpoP
MAMEIDLVCANCGNELDYRLIQQHSDVRLQIDLCEYCEKDIREEESNKEEED